VIPASPLGKVKTVIQVAAILAVIATDDVWAQVLLYLAVLITIVSGADYFLNFRRRIEEARERIAREHRTGAVSGRG
jgi:CDP-diacylglycerol--glycerol-3-phosphate 3-phosphatidyltransferase